MLEEQEAERDISPDPEKTSGVENAQEQAVKESRARKKPNASRLRTRKSKPKTTPPRRNMPSQPRTFPMFSLERSLAVASAIKEKNAGNPWPPTEVSKAMGYAEKSSSVDIILRSSSMYGLTAGTRGASHVILEKLGREIVYAPNGDSEIQAKQRAFLNVELFSKVLGYYKGNNLPEMQFLSNTLVSEFGVPLEYHEEFRKLFDENCKYVGIGTVWSGLGQITQCQDL